jgi:hypothetical protein
MQRIEPVILIVTTQTWRQLTRMALRLSRYGCKVSVLCPAQGELQFFDQLHTRHSFRANKPLDCLEAAILASGADFLVPGDDMAVWLLHELCERAPQHSQLIGRSIGPAHCFPTVRSRPKLLALARSLGLLVPETALARTMEEALAWSQGRSAPFLLKKDGTWGGGGVEIVEDRAELPRHYARLHAAPPVLTRIKDLLLPSGNHYSRPSDSWISEPEVSAQTYIEGTAATAMYACDKGRVLGQVQARVVASKGKTGPAIMIDLLADARIERAGTLLASSLRLSGFFGLDFILEKDTGAPYLIEMNPRCTQLGHVALPGQADLAGLLWAQWSGHPAPEIGGSELSPSVCFYPEALDCVTDSSFLERARLDVSPEDRAVVDRLARGNPALLARSYHAARAHLRTLKRSMIPPQRAPIYYFESTRGTLGQTGAFSPEYAAPGYGRASLG